MTSEQRVTNNTSDAKQVIERRETETFELTSSRRGGSTAKHENEWTRCVDEIAMLVEHKERQGTETLGGLEVSVLDNDR